MSKILSVLRYPGSKDRIAREIVSLFAEHRTYCEPFAGSLAVLRAKERSSSEIVGDRDGEIVNLFRCIRDPEQCERLADLLRWTPWAREEWMSASEHAGDPVERARRYLVRSHQGYGGPLASTGWRHDGPRGGRVGVARGWRSLPDRVLALCERLRGVALECRPALDLIRAYRGPDVLIYADPPYLAETRRAALYAHEMGGAAEHDDLLGVLLEHPGPVILSGYAHPLYESRLVGWSRIEISATAQGGASRTEIVWSNRPVQGDLFGGRP